MKSKRIIAGFLAVVISFSLTIQCVFAAWYNDVAYTYTQSNFMQWSVDSLIEIAGTKAGAAAGAALGSALGPLGTVAGGVLGAVAGFVAKEGFNSLAEFLAAGHTEQELYDVENQYLTDNNLTVVGGGDSLTFQPIITSPTKSELDTALSNGYLQSYSLTDDSVSYVLGKASGSSYSWNAIMWKPSAFFCVSPTFTIPQDGRYWFSFSPSILHPSTSYCFRLQKQVNGSWLDVCATSSVSSSVCTTSTDSLGRGIIQINNWNWYKSSGISLVSGFDYRFSVWYESPSYTSKQSGYYVGYPLSYTFPTFTLHPYNSSASTQAPATTRVGSAMQAINNYNTTNNTVNYYIGTSDANGKITNVYSPDLFNESTLKFTEPVTGTQYVCSNWNYAYTPSARGYYLDLAAGTYSYNGTDIRSIVLAYLDDALYIIGSDQELDDYTVDTYLADAVFVDKYDYVIATAKDDSPSGTTCNHVYTSSTTTAPTCTEQGVRRYTCTLCGHTRDEKVPATGHSWAVTETVETETAENGDVTRAGYTLYTCSACGETYKQWSDTGQPGPPGGGSGSGSGSSGSGGSSGDSFWTKIKNAFSDALASLIESVLSFITDVLDKLLGTVKDLLSFFFDLLNSTVIAGISGFFSGFKDSRLFSFFKKDGSDALALPEGVAAVFAFFSGVIMALPVELRSLLLFGTAFLLLIGVLRILKS